MFEKIWVHKGRLTKALPFMVSRLIIFSQIISLQV